MILVCGATGMFGGRVLDHLLAQKIPPRALTHSPAKATALRERGAAVAIGDLDSPATLPAALDGIERVFLVSPMDDRIALRETALIDAARQADVRHIVKIFGAVRHQGDPLVTQHERVIDHLKSSGIPWTLVSPNTVMESNLLPVAETIRTLATIFGAAGDGRVGLVALDDCARAATTVLTTGIAQHNGQNYEITGPEALTFTDLAARFTHLLGHPISYQDMPVDDFGQMLVTEAGFDPATIETDVLCHFRAFRRGDADLVTNTFTQLTGQPPTTVDAFIETHRSQFLPIELAL
jgi:uncharacterized protein YbjT (DUF2867 family)